MTQRRNNGTAFLILVACLMAPLVFASSVAQAAEGRLDVPVNRSELLTLSASVEEVAVANPDIADVYIHGATRVSVIGKKIGNTSLRIFDHDNNLLKDLDVYVVYDLPAIRRTLSNFFPNERIGVEVVNENLALTGEVTDALIAKRAMQVIEEFVNNARELQQQMGGIGGSEERRVQVLNLTQVRSGQQVMLRVRIGEVQRNTLRNLGINLHMTRLNGNAGFDLVTGNTSSFLTPDLVQGEIVPMPAGAIPSGVRSVSDTVMGVLGIGVQPSDSIGLSAVLDALEQRGLLKIMAEPNLVAVSGEKAEFLAGGEFPVPSVEETDSGGNRITIEFRKFGVSVQFTPMVISANRIRLAVQPEVTEPVGTPYDVQGFPIRNLSTRKVNTTVELAPGESFMIAGLIKDSVDATVTGLPGVSEVPILSSLFRNNNYQRQETELVIAVTPYLIDPVTGKDIKLPTDNFRHASMMETVFYGALGSVTNERMRTSQTPSLEGPVGFMMD